MTAPAPEQEIGLLTRIADAIDRHHDEDDYRPVYGPDGDRCLDSAAARAVMDVLRDGMEPDPPRIEPAEPMCTDCASSPCSRHERENAISLDHNRPADDVQYGVRWQTHGEIAWSSDSRAYLERRYRDGNTGEIRSPLTGELGELVARRVTISPAVAVPFDEIYLAWR